MLVKLFDHPCTSSLMRDTRIIGTVEYMPWESKESQFDTQLWDRCRASSRRNHNPDRRQARHQPALNRARLAVESGRYIGVIDGRDANYDYEGEHYRVFDCRWILEERHRDPGLGLGVRDRLLEGHAGQKILLDADCGGKEAADQRIGIRRLPGRDEVGVCVSFWACRWSVLLNTTADAPAGVVTD